MFQRSTPRLFTRACAGVLLAGIASMAAAGCEEDDSILFPGLSDELSAQLEELRSATEPFQELQDAQAVGYEVLVAHPTNGNRCFRHAQLGGMGFHYLNPDLADDAVSVSSPEVVIYEPQADGSLELVAAEYIVPFSIRGDDEAPPILFGREFRRNYTVNVWALHAWAWKENPSGAFADWNPNVSCANADAVD